MAHEEIERSEKDCQSPLGDGACRQAYLSPVLNRHGSLREMTRGSNIGQPEDFISATTAGT